MVKYSITSQADLQDYLPLSTALDTTDIQNDITIDPTTYTPIGSFTGTLNGNGFKISGVGNRTRNFATANQSANSCSFTSDLSLGETHTITFRQGTTTRDATGAFFPICKGTGDGLYFHYSGTTQIVSYYAAGGWGVSWNLAATNRWSTGTGRTWTLVRSGLTVTLYRGLTNLGARTMPASGKSCTLNEMLRHSSNNWSSGISNVGISNQALDLAWITQQNNNGLGRLVTTANMPGAIFIVNFTEGSGTTATEDVAANNISGIDGWATINEAGGFIDLAAGTINDLCIDTPNITNNVSSNARQGSIANSANGLIVNRCSALNVTIAMVYDNFNACGGLFGYAGNTYIYDCYTSITSIARTPQYGLGGVGWSGGMVGYLSTGSIYKSYVVGTNTTTKPDCGFVGQIQNTAANGIFNCWISMPVDLHVACWSGASYSTVTNLHYNDLSSKTVDNKGSTGTIQANVSDFYDITLSPMDLWDFTWDGVWSPANDGSDFPTYLVNFNADISGTVTGYSSGKDITLLKKNIVYRLVRSSDWDSGVLSSTLTLGNVHTIAWTGENFGTNGGTVFRKASNGDVAAIYTVNGIWKYATDYVGGVFNYKNIAPINTGFSGKHRFVVTRSTDTVKFYMDGALIQTTTGFGTTNTNTADTIFYSSSGYMDALVFTNDCKDQTWVTTDWDSGSYQKRYDGTETGIIYLWNFEENPIYPTATTATDVVGGKVATFGVNTRWVETTDYVTYDTDTVQTTGSGDFTFTGVSDTHGKSIIIYIDGEAVKGGLVTTLTEGTTAVTGVTIEQNAISIGDTELNPDMTYSIVNLADAYPTADTCFRTASNIFYYRDGVDCLVPTGCSYSGTQIIRDSGETGEITIDGTLTAITKLISDTAINLNGTMPASDVQVGGSTTCDVNVDTDCQLTSYGSDVVRDLTINSPADCQCQAFVMKGDLDNAGIFYSSSLSLQGTTQTLTNTGTFSTNYFSPCATVNLFGDMTFGYFTNPSAGDVSITFEHGKTYSLGAFEDTGSSPGHEMHFRSDSPGDRFTIDNISGGELTTSYIDVQDSNVSTNNFNAKKSIDSGNTDRYESDPHWIFWDYQNAFVLETRTLTLA